LFIAENTFRNGKNSDLLYESTLKTHRRKETIVFQKIQRFNKGLGFSDTKLLSLLGLLASFWDNTPENTDFSNYGIRYAPNF
jgi:hypothetical protein